MRRAVVLAALLAGCSAGPLPPEEVMRDVARDEADARARQTEERLEELEQKVDQIEADQRVLERRARFSM